jgi:hypothetical protein
MDTGITRVVYKRNSELCGDAAYLKKPFYSLSASASLPLPLVWLALAGDANSSGRRQCPKSPIALGYGGPAVLTQ